MADTEVIIYVILDILLALVVITGNILVCCVIVNSRTLRKKAMYIFVTSLALADLFVGVTAIPFGILTRLGLPHYNPVLCLVMLSFIMISTQISIFNMTAISIERYIAIRHPRIHFTKLSPKTSIYVIVITWFLSVVVGFLPLLGWNKIGKLSKHPSTSSNLVHNISRPVVNIYPTTTATHERASSINCYSSTAEGANNSLSTASCSPCKFIKIMDENYMFFNFTVCVLPPLFICAILYFAIFLSLKHTRNSMTVIEKNYLKINRNEFSNSKSSVEHINEKSSSVQKESGTTTTVTFKLSELSSKEDIQPAPKANGNVRNSASYNKDFEDTQLISGNYVSKRINEEGSSQRNNNKLNEFFRIKKENVSTGHSDEAKNSNSVSKSKRGRTTSETNYAFFDSPSLHQRNYRQIRARKEIRAAGVLGVIVLAFVVCWLPIHVLNTMNRFDKFSNIQPWLFDVAILLTHSNSAINFFLYSWRLKAFRKQLHRLLARKACCFFPKKTK